MKKNELKSLIIIAISLLFIILCLFVYKNFFYNKNIVKDDTTIVEEEKELESVEVDSKDVKNAMKALEKIKITEEDAYGKTFDITKISKYNLLNTAFTNMLDKGIIKSACSTEKSETITIEEINSELKEIFNRDYNITLTDIEKVGEESEPGSNILIIGIFDIKIDNNKIQINAACDANGGFNFINRNITKAQKDGNTLYIYATVAFGLYDFEVVEYYDTYERLNEKEILKVADYEGVDLDKIPANWELYKTYKYTFNIVGSKYYLNKIELSK